MKRHVIFLLLFSMATLQNVVAQGIVNDESIQVEGNAFMGMRFYQQGKTLTMQEATQAVHANPAAFEHMTKARNQSVLGMILGAAGGFCIGWPIGTAIGGGDPNWVMAGVGAGLVAITIPISISATKHARDGVSLYNEGLSKPQSRLNVDVGLVGAGLGLTIYF